MSLAKKYNIPEQTVKALVKDGWLSCSVPMYEEIYYSYKKKIATNGGQKMQAVYETSIDMGISESWVYKIVERFE